MSTQSQKRFAPKLKIKKGDTVIVTTGEDRGKSGKVLEVFPSKNTALVAGIKIVSKHTKPNAQNQQGGIIKKEAPIHISNLMLSVAGKATKIGRKLEDGKIVRIAKSTGEIIK
ncbi:MAG TPA: 50S ribosomal protein L24 [Chitinophagales bacterium]|jgi:large subunit ribosomal protein L24|nr:50S ribosomal protein L24 [Chitinophagales bacterium]HQV77947.1 50S ribosomal protein L24 [Chitinophagales bacterium]HQW78669.1 50S ribosomal protein L24 [Chitinophagales bacterium]HRB18450.1 50S ribosomal protein L24 [Chitinophagales bacterium]HRB66324.1 50S ribosomal protein L24 [Chitinophagales bacterium]